MLLRISQFLVLRNFYYPNTGKVSALHTIVIVEDEPETLGRFERLVDESELFECLAALFTKDMGCLLLP